MTDDRVHLVQDGVWPDDAGEADWVVFVPSTANAAMWLERDEPERAFLCIEGTVGYQARTVLERAGWPVSDTNLRTDAEMVRQTFERAVNHLGLAPHMPLDVTAALGALDTLVRARMMLDALPDGGAVADVLVRGVLTGFAASTLGMNPKDLQQPTLQSAGGAKRGEQRRGWWPIAARRAESLAKASPTLTLAAIGRAIHKEMAAAGVPHIPQTPEKVAERLRALGRAGKLTWPASSKAAE